MRSRMHNETWWVSGPRWTAVKGVAHINRLILNEQVVTCHDRSQINPKLICEGAQLVAD